MANGKTAKYLIVKRDLKKIAIEEEAGYRIPNIHELMDKYNMSITPVWRAVRELATEGYLESIKGQGTFVKKRPEDQNKTEISHRIGLAMAEDRLSLHHPFYGQLVHIVSNIAHDHGYDIEIVLKRNGKLFGSNRERGIQKLSEGYFAGIMLESYFNDEDIQLLLDHEIPTVNINEEYTDVKLCSVLVDRVELINQPLQYCVERGCSNIMFLAPVSGSHANEVFLRAYQMCLASYGLKFKPENYVLTELSDREAYNVVKQRFSESGNKPDAILASSGYRAYGAYVALQELGITVPDDIILVQGNDVFVDPSLKAIVPYSDVHINQVCQEAINMLIKLINKEAIDIRKKYVKPQLVLPVSTTKKPNKSVLLSH